MATNPPIYPHEPPKSNLPLALAFGAIVAMLAGNIYLFLQIQDLKKDASKTSDAMQAEIEKLQEDTVAVGATSGITRNSCVNRWTPLPGKPWLRPKRPPRKPGRMP